MAKLYFYHSVMNSGKSAHIIMQIHNLREQGKNVLVLKPRMDTRDFGEIKSRALETTIEANLIDDNSNIYEYVIGENPDYIFVDEVNFLSADNIEQLADVVDILGINVFGYGLLVDYTGKQFEGSKRMVELADSIRELKSPCVKCERKATMHLRSVNGKYVFSGNPIQVGDIDSYESVCRYCYTSAKKSYTYSKEAKNDVIFHKDYLELILRDNKGNETCKTAIDIEDFDKVKNHSWYLSQGYPTTRVGDRTYKIHMFIMGEADGLIVDHRDRNTLNNRRENLFHVTHKQNAINKGIQSNNTSGIIGVSYFKKNGKWRAYIKTDRFISLGYYDNIDDAIYARLNAESEYFGELAPQRNLFDEYGIYKSKK